MPHPNGSPAKAGLNWRNILLMVAFVGLALPVLFGARIRALLEPRNGMVSAPYLGVERPVTVRADVTFPAWLPVPEGAVRVSGVHFPPHPGQPEAGMILLRAALPLPDLLAFIRGGLEAEGFVLAEEAPPELAALRGAAIGRDAVIGARDGRGRAVAVAVLSLGDQPRPEQAVQFAWQVDP